ncbi:hypothetical protein [Shimia sagamensis]|uniref:DUF4384 domain-containing protein n=1 Tax=Shimia sagamensis TaxID=1566352 RepID=A0ABY1PIW9_9RHOB|nr:hypothetical protein [Shimia sagamensis]SMP34744.1 hypothetical protein SAMN06265373_11082 [Shimia sagamensis]
MVLATFGSLVLHGAAASLGAALVVPTPVPQQTLPDSMLSLTSLTVTRSDARPTTPDTQHLQADGLSAVVAPALSSRDAVQASHVTARASLTSPILKSAATPTARLMETKINPATQDPLVTVHARIPALSTDADPAKAEPLISPPIVATSQAVPSQIAADLQELKLNTAKPASVTIHSTAPASPQYLAQRPAAPRVSAAFDWNGAPSFDAASLDTVSAFLRPGSSAGQNMRDTLAAALKAPKCARVQSAFDPESGTLALRGHLRDEAQRAPLLASVSEQLGDSLPLNDQLLILPAPQCTILALLDQLDLPQSEEQFTDQMLVGDTAQVQTYDFVAGQRLIIDLEAPDYPAFVYLDYFDSNGNVIHLVPSAQRPLQAYDPAALFSIGRPDPDTGATPALVLEIAPPFGQDIAVAYAASHPLYVGLRPFIEPAAAYLTFLQDRISQVRTTHADFRGEWAYLFVVTRQKRN